MRPAPIEPHALALRILSEARFRVRVPPARPGWWDALWRWLSDRWNQLVNAFAAHVHFGKHVTAAFGDVLLAAVALFVTIAAARLVLQIARDHSAQPATASSDQPQEDAQMLIARASQAAQRGAHGVAIVLLFRATLASLDLRHVVAEAPSSTVNEYRAQVRSRTPELSQPFDTIARAFTSVAYADAAAGEREWMQVRDVFAAHFDGPLRA